MKTIETMKTPGIKYFDVTHRYFLDSGRQLTAVSEVLRLCGINDFTKVKWEIREAAGIMGDCAHEIGRLYGLGNLDEDNLDHELFGYLESIKKFYAKRVARILFIGDANNNQGIVYDEKLGFAGTLDIVYQDAKNRVCLDDWKTGEILPGYRLQIAAYKHAFEKTFKIPIDERASVKINKDGSFDVKKDREVYEGRQDWNDFLSCLGVAYFKQRNKLTQ